MSNSSWRDSLATESRQKILRRIVETLERTLPDAGRHRRLRAAQRFEAEVFQAAADIQDYLRKIALKMLHFETQANQRAQN